MASSSKVLEPPDKERKAEVLENYLQTLNHLPEDHRQHNHDMIIIGAMSVTFLSSLLTCSLEQPSEIIWESVSPTFNSFLEGMGHAMVEPSALPAAPVAGKSPLWPLAPGVRSHLSHEKYELLNGNANR